MLALGKLGALACRAVVLAQFVGRRHRLDGGRQRERWRGDWFIGPGYSHPARQPGFNRSPGLRFGCALAGAIALLLWLMWSLTTGAGVRLNCLSGYSHRHIGGTSVLSGC